MGYLYEKEEKLELRSSSSLGMRCNVVRIVACDSVFAFNQLGLGGGLDLHVTEGKMDFLQMVMGKRCNAVSVKAARAGRCGYTVPCGASMFRYMSFVTGKQHNRLKCTCDRSTVRHCACPPGTPARIGSVRHGDTYLLILI